MKDSSCQVTAPSLKGGRGESLLLPLPFGGGSVFLFLFFFCSLFFLSSCREEVKLSPEELARRDSAALHVALMPVEDCLPFYLAQRAGIYERLGLDVRIHTYQAQLDIDTALTKGHVAAGYSDLARAIMLQQDTVDVRAIVATTGRLDLITARRGRVRQLSQLKERMVAIARHSITDYWSDRLTDSASMRRADIFRPQINDVRIRTDMLCNGTMDAAFLPEPYASEALMRGNKRNFTTFQQSPRLAVLLACSDALADTARLRQLRLLLQGYDEVQRRFNDTPAISDSLRPLLHELCLTPDTLIDSLILRLPKFQPLSSPQQTDVDAALQWLNGRGKVKKGYAADTLIHDLHGSQGIQ